MGNDIEIRVRVANNTATGLAAVNRSLNRLRDEARDAGRGLDGLTTRAAATAVALRSLKDAAQDASRALRSLNTAARNADGRLSTMSDRSRQLRTDTDDLDESMRRLTGTLGGLRGGVGSIRLTDTSNGMDGLRKAALLLSPALIPIAAAAVPIAANLAAAGVAVGAFALAVGGQVAVIAKASEAEKKYEDAVKEHGRTSVEAAKAETAYLRTVRDMDPATRRAAAAFSVFKDSYKDWTQSLAGDTMPVVTKGFATFGALLPRLTPMVRATSGELDRLMTVLAGGVNSSGFERFMDSFAQFASGALSKATDGLLGFMRAMSGGAGSSQFTEFMAYVREAGPQVAETLGNLGRALAHMVVAASDAGIGILSVVNAFAKLVNAVPTETLSTLLQLVLVFKGVRLGVAGLAAVGSVMAAFRAQLVAAGSAAVGATGGLATLGAAFMALSRTAKLAIASTGIGILVIALSELAQMGKSTSPDVDRLTTSLGELGRTGKATGIVAEEFGKNFEKLRDQISKVIDPSVAESINNWGADVTGGLLDAGDATEKFTESIDAIDTGLANLVSGGKADQAKAALALMLKGMDSAQAKKFKEGLDGYREALAASKFEQQLAAQAMGLFGQQAQATSEKLAAQKASADGLRQSIQALNDVNRQGLGGMIGFEAAIDAAAKAARDNAGALSMTHGQLDLNSKKAQDAAAALNDLASKTDEAAASARESGSSWSTVNGIYERGRAQFIASARAMGLTKTEARQLADQILKMPSKTAMLKGDVSDLKAKLADARARLAKAPLSKRGKIWGDITDLNRKIAAAQARINGLKGRIVKIGVNTVYSYSGHAGPGGIPKAEGGPIEGGSGFKDDVPILAMGGEFMVNKKSTAKHRSLLEAINEDKLPKFAKGGVVSKSEREARKGARGDLTLSYFGQKAGNKNTEFVNALGSPSSLKELVSALNQWRNIIKKATHGGVEENLLKKLNSAGKALTKYEKQHDAITKTLEKAKALRDSVKSGVLSATNITQAASGEGQLTTQGLIASMVQDRDKATAFAQALKDLRKKGVDKNIIKQIAEAGIEGGGLETAGALLTASSSEIKSINTLQSQISKAASKAGNAAADAMYGAGLKAGEGIIAGLEKKQDAIEKAMLKIAKGMEKAIKKALGIKSPSTVMEEVGDYTAEGFAVGMRRNRSVTPAWESMLNTPSGGRPAAGGGVSASAVGAPAPFVLQVKLGNRDMGEVWVDVGRKQVRAHGSIEATLKPPR